MSDRGYKCVALKMQAHALVITAKGHEAYNNQHDGQGYGEEVFHGIADQLNELAKKAEALSDEPGGGR